VKYNEARGDLAKQISINKYKLDDECQEQASNFHFWAELQADAKTVVDRAENKLKLIEAEAQARATKVLEQAGMKTTVDAVKAKALQDPEVKEATEALITAREELYHLDAAVRALDHKKSELDNLVKLWGSSYFSFPTGGPPKAEPGATVSRDARASLNRNRKGEDA
jgi:hypothetical protein